MASHWRAGWNGSWACAPRPDLACQLGSKALPSLEYSQRHLVVLATAESLQGWLFGKPPAVGVAEAVTRWTPPGDWAVWTVARL